MPTHRIAMTQTLTVYYEFEGTLEQAEKLCKRINDAEVDDIDEEAEFVGESDWIEYSNARVV